MSVILEVDYIEEMDPFLLDIVVLSYLIIDPFQGRSVTDDSGLHVTGSALGNLSKEGFELSPSLCKEVRKEVIAIDSILSRPVRISGSDNVYPVRKLFLGLPSLISPPCHESCHVVVFSEPYFQFILPVLEFLLGYGLLGQRFRWVYLYCRHPDSCVPSGFTCFYSGSASG